MLKLLKMSQFSPYDRDTLLIKIIASNYLILFPHLVYNKVLLQKNSVKFLRMF